MLLYYFSLSTPALSTLMVAEAVGQPYDRRFINLHKREQQEPEFVKINPMAKVPAMVDGDFVLTESVAIQKYIAQKNRSELYPDGIKKQGAVDRWLSLVIDEVRSPVLDIEVHRWIAQKKGRPVNDGVVALSVNRLGRSLPVLNDRLSTFNFLNGEHLTIADVTLISALDPVDVVEYDISEYESVHTYLDWGRKQPWYKAVNSHFGAGFTF